MTVSIKNSSLRYRLSLSTWTARKKDKTQTAKVNADAGAATGAANVNKQLLPGVASLEAIHTWVASTRTAFYNQTLPWDDTGWRVGRAEKHLDFSVSMAARLDEGRALVDVFINEYEAAIEQSRFTLNGMFNEADYPTAAEVREKFNFSMEVQTIGDANDFRVVEGVPSDEVDQLIAAAEKAAQERVDAAMASAADRLYEVVAKVPETLTRFANKEVKRFNDTLIDNVTTTAEVLRGLNLTGDVGLDKRIKAAAILAARYPASDLRNDESARNAAIADYTKLVNTFGKTPLAAAPAPTPAKPKLTVVPKEPEPTPAPTPDPVPETTPETVKEPVVENFDQIAKTNAPSLAALLEDADDAELVHDIDEQKPDPLADVRDLLEDW